MLPCKSVKRRAAACWTQSVSCVWWDNLSSCRRGDTPWWVSGSFVLKKGGVDTLFIGAPGWKRRHSEDFIGWWYQIKEQLEAKRDGLNEEQPSSSSLNTHTWMLPRSYLRCNRLLYIWRCFRGGVIWGSRFPSQSPWGAPPCCAAVSSRPPPPRYCPAGGHTCTSPRCQSFPAAQGDERGCLKHEHTRHTRLVCHLLLTWLFCFAFIYL